MTEPLVRTPREFLARQEDGDRWIEMVNGRLIRLSPPDEQHGNVVRNLSKALSQYLRKRPTHYLCFELALLVSPATNTIRCPAVSCFPTENGLDELDKLLSETVPVLVIEIASSNDRREAMSDRIRGYQVLGVPYIWVLDPESQHAHVFTPQETPRMLKETEVLTSQSLFPGFGILVGDLFRDPAWLNRTPPADDAN